MAIFTGKISNFTKGETARGKPQLTFTLTAETEITQMIVFTEERISLFAGYEDGDEITVRARASHGRFAPEGFMIVNEINPEAPASSPFYVGEGIKAGQSVIFTAGSFARKQIVGMGTALLDISADDINGAQEIAAQYGITWQEALVDLGCLTTQGTVELHMTRAYRKADTRPALQHYEVDLAAGIQHLKSVSYPSTTAQEQEVTEALAA